MATTIVAPAIAGEIEILTRQTRAIHGVVRRNVEGFTQEDSLKQPEPGGNCLNWVLGHLLCIYDQVLPGIGQEPVLGVGALKRYERGSAELHNAGEALPLADLLAAWDEAAKRVEAGLGTLTAEKMDARAPFSPSNNPKETLRSLLAAVFFHQAYHSGQTGLLRRIAGKEGAIR
jgi:DinB family protein